MRRVCDGCGSEIKSGQIAIVTFKPTAETPHEPVLILMHKDGECPREPDQSVKDALLASAEVRQMSPKEDPFDDLAERTHSG